MKEAVGRAAIGIVLCVAGVGTAHGEGNDSYAKLLLHCNGADGSTNFTDSSSSGKTVVAQHHAALDTAQSRYGGASGLFDGSDDFLMIADSDDWFFGTGDFTLDFWVRFLDASPGSQMFIAQRVDDAHQWRFGWGAGRLDFWAGDSPIGVAYYTMAGYWNPVPGQWYHIALVRSGAGIFMFIDGVSQTLTVLNPIGNRAMPDVAAPLSVGNSGHVVFPDWLDGWLDEVRVSKGIARWTSDFSPPVAEYTVNAPPAAFSLTAPSDGTATGDGTPVFSWEAATDPDPGDNVTYSLKLSLDPGFSTPLYRTVSGLTATSHTPPAGQEIDDGVYYWKVVASDGMGETESAQTRILTVDTQPPVAPSVTEVHSVLNTGDVTNVYGTGENGTTLVFRNREDNPIAGAVQWDGSGNFTFTPSMPIDSGAVIYVESKDAAANSSVSRRRTIEFRSFVDIFMDSVTQRGNGAGASVRLERDTSCTFALAANAGSPVAVRAWMRKNAAYGSGAQPKITLTGPGIDGTGAAAAAMAAGADAWEELSVTGTPTAQGVLALRVETFSTAADARCWVDDVSVVQE